MVEQSHNTAGVAVADLRDATALGRARLVSGADGLARLVRRVQWMEVLDDHADFLAPGDLLLTTAYNLRDDPALQRVLAADLDATGVAAIVVKCGYYLDAVPHAVRSEADRLHLPVFELDREVPFVELSQSIYERLVTGSYARLRRSAGIHRELVRLVVEGADLATIVRRAAVLLGGAVAVEDDAGRPLAAASQDGRPLWPHPPVDGGITAPVMSRGVLHGRVALLSGCAREDDDRQALEQVATVVALEIAKSDHERAAEARLVAELTRELVRSGGGPNTAEHAKVLGATLPDPGYVLRARGGDLADGLVRLRATLGGRPLAARDGDDLVAVLGPADADAVQRWLRDAGDGWSAGLSDAAASIDLVEADRQARMARTLGAALTGPGLHRYQQLAIYDSLLGELDGPRAARIHERTLARLSPELARTLELYLQTGSSVAATARSLFVHRNTVHYRLHRIEAETGLQLDRLEHRMLCELALLADRIGGRAAP
jgi:PucR family transcriptional regulator, purine catabolism regulatory protein